MDDAAHLLGQLPEWMIFAVVLAWVFFDKGLPAIKRAFGRAPTHAAGDSDLAKALNVAIADIQQNRIIEQQQLEIMKALERALDRTTRNAELQVEKLQHVHTTQQTIAQAQEQQLRLLQAMRGDLGLRSDDTGRHRFVDEPEMPSRQIPPPPRRPAR